MAVEAPAEQGSLARGAAAISVATIASRLTGFLRVVVVAYALGGTFLANTYQTANTAPNVLFELVAAGVLTSVFVPTFIEYLVRDEREEGWQAASVLTSVALVALIGLALVLALAAPFVMRLLTVGVENEALRQEEIALGSTFLRLFAPQVVFYGVGMIMTGALHAYRRFALPAIAPIFNNVIVIGVYLAYAAMRGDDAPSVGEISSGETLVLGLGTTFGVVAMTVVLWPQLRRLGWRFRWSFRPSHPAVAKASRLGVWALGYAGGYQAGLLVVLLLANKVGGGVAAYQWAYTFFYVPHALFAAPIFYVLFPALSEHKARAEPDDFATRLRGATSMLLFLLVPIGGLMAVTSQAIAGLTLQYGVMTAGDAALVGRVIAAFSIGLPAYSAFVVFTRAFYALEDPRTPTLVNLFAVIVASAAGAVLFFALPQRWAVPGLALGHSLGFVIGAVVLALVLRRRLPAAGRSRLGRSLLRVTFAGTVAIAAMMGVANLVSADTRTGALIELVLAGSAGGLVYLATMAALRAPELGRVLALTGRRRWRSSAGAKVSGRTLEVLGRSAGGTAVHVVQIVEGLDGKDGLRIDVAGPSDLPVRFPKEVLELDIPNGPVFGHRAAIKRIRGVLQEGGYATVHAHGLRAGIDAALAARGSGVRVLLTVHNLVQPEIAGGMKARLYSRAEPLAVRLASLTFAASEQIAEHLRDEAPSASERIEVLHVPIGAPPAVKRSREEVRAELEVPEGKRVIVSVARLAPQKALHVTLEALASLDGCVLAVVGEGPLEEELRRLAARLGVADRVRWMGFRDDAADFIAAADVLCLSSVWEAVALVAQEAVLLSTPVVATDVGGIRELIPDEDHGRLVPKGDVAALAAALRAVLASPEEADAMATRALAHYRSRFAREAMLERLRVAYLEDDDV